MSAGKTVAKVGAGVVLGLGVLYGADLALSHGQVPRGVSVGGVSIGGMSHEDAVAKLDQDINTTKPVTITAGDLRSTVNPLDAGITPDWKATVDSAGRQSLSPIVRITSFFSDHEVDVTTSVDDAKLKPQLERVTKELSPDPVNAAMRLEGGEVRVDPKPSDGQRIDSRELRKDLLADWLRPEGVSLQAKVAHPDVDEDAVEKASDGPVKAALSGPIVVHGREGIDGVIPVERMGEVVTFDERLNAKVNTEAAQKILENNLSKTEQPMKNAQISISGGEQQITPHADGVSVNWEETLAGFEDRVIGGAPKEFEAAYKDEPATYTTEMAKGATFRDVVGEFTTGGYSAASGVNIARVAQMVNGAFVAPGETFSLNGYTGPRGTAQGFVESGVILNGHADKAVGGGISQFATTLYNASYFAGMQDVTHTPHSYYISRYPAGREATVYEGAIDLQFKNTSKYPVIIESSAGGGSVTVRLKGVKTVNVESVNGGRWSYTSPQVMNLSGPTCSPSSGAQGFTTSDTRIIRDLSGNELSRESQTTVYDPQPIVRCS